MLDQEQKTAFLDGLWQSAQSRGDFPALAQSVRRIVETVQEGDTEDVDLSHAVLEDFALTHKVLRLANSPMYSVFDGEVTTVSRALSIIGQDAVGHVALGMKLIGSLDAQAADDEPRRRELSKAVLAGTLARGLAEQARVREAEEAAVCTLLHQVGKLLVMFHRPDLWQQIAERVAAGHPEREAALVVAGVDLAEVGAMVASRWRLPERMVQTLGPPDDAGVADPGDHTAWLRNVAHAATELGDAFVDRGGDAQTIAAIAARYADRIGLAPEAIAACAQASVASDRGARLIRELRDTPRRTEAAAHEFGKRHARPAPPATDVNDVQVSALDRALAAIEGMASDLPFGQLVTRGLETLHGALGASRALLFMRDKASKSMVARSACGSDARSLAVRPASDGKAQPLAFPDAFAPDVFHLALANDRIAFIASADDPAIVRRLPQWYRETVTGARAFLLLPLCVQERPVALVYLDWTARDEVPDLGRAEIESLQRIRDVLLAALASARLRAAAGEAAQQGALSPAQRQPTTPLARTDAPPSTRAR